MLKNLKVNDSAWSLLYGIGIVTHISKEGEKPICVKFIKDGFYVNFTLEGKMNKNDVNQSLFETEMEISLKPIFKKDSCIFCENARIAAGDLNSERYVACVYLPDGRDTIENLSILEKNNYTGTGYADGWSYHQVPPFGKPNGVMSSTFILVETDAKCSKYKQKK